MHTNILSVQACSKIYSKLGRGKEKDWKMGCIEGDIGLQFSDPNISRDGMENSKSKVRVCVRKEALWCVFMGGGNPLRHLAVCVTRVVSSLASKCTVGNVCGPKIPII